jgi:hypothetical protein
MTDTKERPILFSAPMIRALLDGCGLTFPEYESAPDDDGDY